VTLHALIVIHAAAPAHLLRRRTTSLLSRLAEIVKPEVSASPLPYYYTFFDVFEVAQIDPTLASSRLPHLQINSVAMRRFVPYEEFVHAVIADVVMKARIWRVSRAERVSLVLRLRQDYVSRVIMYAAIPATVLNITLCRPTYARSVTTKRRCARSLVSSRRAQAVVGVSSGESVSYDPVQNF